MTYEDALAILRDGWPIAPEELTQIAADIWDEGWDVGRRFQGPHSNPYKRNENA